MQAQLREVGLFLFTAWGLGLLWLDSLRAHRSEPRERGLAALCIGGAVIAPLTYVLALLERALPGSLRVGGALLALAGIGRLALEGVRCARIRAQRPGAVMAVAAAIALLLILRLAFLKNLLLPPYTDSVIHYQIVRGMVLPELADEIRISIPGLVQQYYHLGFHSVAAWLSSVTGQPVEGAIPLLGQLYLVLAALSASVLTMALTDSRDAALWAALLAALAFRMPAFAANWGKYPAISAIATLPAVMACVFWLRGSLRGHSMWISVLVLIGAVTLLHTRALVPAAVMLVAWWLAGRLVPAEGLGVERALRFSVLYVVSLAPLIYVLREFYGAVAPAVVVIGLLPFAFLAFPRVAIACYVFTFGLWAITLLPSMLGDASLVVLNQQFVEILLYLPLAVLGGAGLGGLISRLKISASQRAARLGATAIASLLLATAWSSLRPDPCCNYVEDGDLRAIQWIGQNAAEDSLVLTSSFSEDGQVFGTDAGIWIQPLTGRSTNRIRFDTDWSEGIEVASLCTRREPGIYIYVGGAPWSFRSGALAKQPWAELAFQAGATAVYRVATCEAFRN